MLLVSASPDTFLFSNFDATQNPAVYSHAMSAERPWFKYNSDILMDFPFTGYYYIPSYSVSRYLGWKNYELTDHLGNVNVSVLDKISGTGNALTGQYAYLSANISSLTDYYPFGMAMPGRSMSMLKYRYGFNGMEKDDEVKGADNSIDFGARMYDARLGRWMSVDPLGATSPSINPYNYVINNPIIYVDPNGKKEFYYKIVITQSNGSCIINVVFDHSSTELTDYLNISDHEYYLINSKGKEIRGLIFESVCEMMSYVAGKTEAEMERDAEINNIKTAQSMAMGAEMSMNMIEAAAYDPTIGGTNDDIPISQNASINTNGYNSGKLRQVNGTKYETFLQKKLGALPSFTAKSNTASREFDGAYGNVWYEAKSGDFFTKNFNFEKFKSDMGRGLNVAKFHNKTYELISENKIPEDVKIFLDKKNIKYKENIKQQ